MSTPSRDIHRIHGRTSDQFAEATGKLLLALPVILWGILARPWLSGPLLIAGVLWWQQGPATLVLFALLLTVAMVVWLMLDRKSWVRYVFLPARSGVRRFWLYQPKWTRVMRGCKLTTTHRGSERVPKLKRVRCDKATRTDRLLVKLLEGQAPEDLAKVSEGIRHSYRADSCRVQPGDKPGDAWIVLRKGEPFAAVIPPLPIPEVVDLEAVPIGRREDGKPWTVQLLGTHILIGGATGAGKASVLWSILRGIAPDVRSGLVQVYAADGKGGMELKFGRDLFTRYEDDTLEGMLEMLREVIALMEVRSRELAGVSRKHVPTFEQPMLLVLVDEVADLTTCEDSKLQKQFRTAFELLLRKGRAVGVTVVLSLQEPRKEALPFRGLIPDGIALRLKERLEVDMVLGPTAYAMGALCTKINGAPDTEQGTGYVWDAEGQPVMVRASYVTDEDIQAMASEYAPNVCASSSGDVAPEVVARLRERWEGPKGSA